MTLFLSNYYIMDAYKPIGGISNPLRAAADSLISKGCIILMHPLNHIWGHGYRFLMITTREKSAREFSLIVGISNQYRATPMSPDYS